MLKLGSINIDVTSVVAGLLTCLTSVSGWAGHGPQEARTHARWNGNLLGTPNPQTQLC
jgi:hypothetical protein